MALELGRQRATLEQARRLLERLGREHHRGESRRRGIVLDCEADIADSQLVVLCAAPEQRLIGAHGARLERGTQGKMIQASDHEETVSSLAALGLTLMGGDTVPSYPI